MRVIINWNDILMLPVNTPNVRGVSVALAGRLKYINAELLVTLPTIAPSTP
jgi:hypothetical protein